MKTLILTAFLTLTMNAFADQVSDVDCSALSDSTDRISTEVSTTSGNNESESVEGSVR